MTPEEQQELLRVVAMVACKVGYRGSARKLDAISARLYESERRGREDEANRGISGD